MNYYGGLVGAIVAVVIYARAKKIDILEWGDMLLTGLPLGYMFGRIGNFINGELYGRLAKAPWGVLFPNAGRVAVAETWVQEYAMESGVVIQPGQTLVNLPRHPTQLYEAFAEGIVLWLILWFLVRHRRPFVGFTTGIYIVLYGLFRFVIDYFRMPISASDFFVRLSPAEWPIHLVESPLNLIPSRLCSLLMIVGGVVFLIVIGHLKSGSVDILNEPYVKPTPWALRKKLKGR